MRVRYTRQAFAEREEIFAYIDERSPTAGRAIKAFLDRSLVRIADFPFSAPAVEGLDVRELSLLRYPYKIYYRIVGDEAWIVHMRHASRRPLGEDDA